MYFSSGNIFILMEKDFHIPILPGSWRFILFCRKAKIIVIPFFFAYRKSTIRLTHLYKVKDVSLCFVWKMKNHFPLISSVPIKSKWPRLNDNIWAELYFPFLHPQGHAFWILSKSRSIIFPFMLFILVS